MSNVQKLLPRKLVDLAIQQLQENISLGHYQPSQKIPPEPELMVELGIGRSTLREAVKVLANAGLLEVRHGEGTFVSANPVIREPLDQRLKRASLLEVFEVKRILELEIAELAARNRTEDDMSQLKLCLENRKFAVDNQDIHAYIKSDVEFHSAVVAATHNSVLKDLYGTFSVVLQKALFQLLSDIGLFESQIQIHEKIYHAIQEKNDILARKMTADYLDMTMKQLRQNLK